MKFIKALALSTLVLSCGGGNDSNETNKTEQPDNPNPGKKELNCDTEFCRNNLVVPSINNAGEFVQACVKGEVFVNDNCAEPKLNIDIINASFLVTVEGFEYAYIDANLNSRTSQYYEYIDEKIVPSTGNDIFDSRLDNLYDFKGYNFDGTNVLQYNTKQYINSPKALELSINNIQLARFFKLDKFEKFCGNLAKSLNINNYGVVDGVCLLSDDLEKNFRTLNIESNCNNFGCYISEVTLYKGVNDEAKE